MTDDIVTRLRHSLAVDPDIDADLTADAADEIERLRSENIVLRKAVGEEGRANRMTMLYESAQPEIERLRAEVKRLTILNHAFDSKINNLDKIINNLCTSGDIVSDLLSTLSRHKSIDPSYISNALKKWDEARRGEL